MGLKRRIKRILWLCFALTGILIIISLPHIWADLVYPLRYEAEISQAATEFNLPPPLIAGVIYTESHFNPNALSPVGARGLMQIMPATGAGIAASLGESDYSHDKLYDPKINIRYGSYYLRSLLDRYSNDLDVVLVAYNGGSSVANRYQLSRATTIPLETSGFIGKVKRARDAYEKIYGSTLTQNAGSNLSDQLKKQEEKTLWDQIFGWLFNK